jgi:hypothetical protein
LHQFSWKVSEICAVYHCVVSSALASYLILVCTYDTRHTSWRAAIDMHLFVGPDTRKRWSCRSIPDEESKTTPVPGGAILSFISNWVPAIPSHFTKTYLLKACSHNHLLQFP